MDKPSPGHGDDPSGCLGWVCRILVVTIAVPALLSATGVCAAVQPRPESLPDDMAAKKSRQLI